MTKAPISSSSLRIGTAMSDRAPPYLAAGLCQFVDGVNNLPCPQHAIERGPGKRWTPSELPELPKELIVCRWHVEPSGRMERVSIVTEQHTKIGLANSHRIRQHGLENRLEFAGRAADYAEHFGSCRL